MTTAASPDDPTTRGNDEASALAFRACAQELLRRSGMLGAEVTRALAERLGDPELAGNATVLLVATLAERGPLRPRDLQPITGVTSGGMTRQLDRLEARGLIERSFGTVPGDRRAIAIDLTDTGRRTATLMAEVLEAHEDRVRAFVDAVTASLEDAGAIAPAPAGPDLRSAATSPAVARSSIRVLYLLGLVGTEIRDAMLRAAADADLVENLPIAVLAEIDAAGSTRPTDLLRSTRLSSGGLTKLLDRLEERGLIERHHGLVAADRRAIVITITPEGNGLVGRFASELATRSAVILGLLREIGLTLGTGR